MNNGYSICFNEWALDKEIKNELGLLLIISSLCAEKGYCFASNEYFAKLFEINEISVSRKIKLLEEKGYITIDYEKRGCEITKRNIRLTKMITDDYQKSKSTINKNIKDNNTSMNNININNNISSSLISNNIYDYLQDNGFILTPIHYEVIQQWDDNELTRYAIKKAVLNGKYNINYIDKILFNWKKENITTLEQAKAQEDEFEKAKEFRDKIKNERKMSFSEKLDMWSKEWEDEEEKND